MVDLRSRLRSELRSLELEGVEETGNELGRGAYGVVVEVKLHGLLCAGKKLHDALLQYSDRQAQEEALMKFAEECLLHSRQRHPNIVQLIGVCFRPRSSIPTLVMEYLPMSGEIPARSRESQARTPSRRCSRNRVPSLQEASHLAS